MVTTVIRQIMATLCGIVIPRVMIGAFGSEVYGATTSIAQFLSYISLLEGGIGRVARGALYKPLSIKDDKKISGVYQAIVKFFRRLGITFLLYTVILAFVYYDLADVQAFSRKYTAGLVLVISLSTAATYFGGIANMTLMHADQKQYLTNTIITVTNLINTLCVVILVFTGADILTVKLISSIVFLSRPILYSSHVKKNYAITKSEADSQALSQKWTGLGQHIAYFLHTNTDVVMLTLLADLKMVAVYAVYYLVVSSIWNIASAFSGGMEAAFGSMIAKGEQAALINAYRSYKSILTLVALILFGSTAVLILPFVQLYTKGVTDANYIQPTFALVLIMAEFMNTLALPCTTLPISANMLKQTKWGSYGEALINIVISLSLIRWNPLIGVAIGTFAASLFKCLFYMTFASKKLLRTNIWEMIGGFFLCMGVLCGFYEIGKWLYRYIALGNMLQWIVLGGIVVLLVAPLALLICVMLYPQEMKVYYQKIRSNNRQEP